MHSAYYPSSRNLFSYKNSNFTSSFEQIHFPGILISETLLRSRQCKILLQEIQFYILQVHQFQWQTSFIHSTLLRAPIGIEFNFYFKNFQSVIHHSYAPTWTRDSKAEPGTFFKNKDSMWQILQATRKQVLQCI